MKGYISSSNDDWAMVEEFLTHLKGVERAIGIEFWTVKKILDHSKSQDEVYDAIKAADVLVLLVSPNYVASDLIFDKELPAIKARNKEAKSLIIPVIMQPCMWQHLVGSLQAVPVYRRGITNTPTLYPTGRGHRASENPVEARHLVSGIMLGY